MRLSNTGFRPPVDDQVTPYEIPPIGLRPLVETPLQNDDSRVRRRLHRLRSVRRHCTRTRAARPCTRPGENRAWRTWSTRVSRSAGLGDETTVMEAGSTPPMLSTTKRTTATPPMMEPALPPRHSGMQLYSVSRGGPPARR